MTDPISDLIREMNGPGQLANLRAAGYMSPVDSGFDGHGFSCMRCDFIEKKDGQTGFCTHPEIRASVELRGCSNLFTYKGIHT